MIARMLATHKQWLLAAEEDLRLARTLLREQNDFYPPICFHSQQAVEKALKAFLYFYRVDEDLRGHRLETLLQRCNSFDASIDRFAEAVRILDQYYLPTRYPDAFPGMTPSGVYHATEAHEALQYAEDILAYVRQSVSKTAI